MCFNLSYNDSKVGVAREEEEEKKKMKKEVKKAVKVYV